MVFVVGRRKLNVVIRPKKIRYGSGLSCAVLSETDRAGFAAFVKILMTAQREVSQKTSKKASKRTNDIIDLKQKGSLKGESFYFVEWLYQYLDGFTNYLSFE